MQFESISFSFREPEPKNTELKTLWRVTYSPVGEWAAGEYYYKIYRNCQEIFTCFTSDRPTVETATDFINQIKTKL